MKISNFFIIFFVLIVAIVLRFYYIDTNPPSLTWDEAAWGYNAYALGIDGRDEFGRFLPHDYLESFGDFKPPMYAYLAILPVKIFGLTEFAVRFPSAFFGVLTVLLTYLLVNQIFPNKLISLFHVKFSMGDLAAFFLAISPWHINLSRAAFEANVATFFLVGGVLMFLVAVQKNRWYLAVSAIFFVLSMYTFNTARVVAPLLAFSLAVGFYKKLWTSKKETIISGIVGLLLLLPTFNFLFSPQAQLRFREVNIFTDLSVVETANQQIENDHNAFWSKILHNRRLAFGVEFLKHYLDNISPSFLFIKGDGNPKFSTQDVGQLYLWDLPFLLIGILLLFKKKENFWWILPIWFILGVIPAATARETPHALRIETTIPVLQILVAYGLFITIEKIVSSKYTWVNKKTKYFLCVIIAAILLGNFLYYIHGYYAHYPKEFSGEWQYGYKDSIDYVKSVEKEYENVIITDKLGRPYIYYLFYNKTDPETFRKNAVVTRDAYGFVHVESFGKYIFIDDPNKKIDHLKRLLYVNIAGREAEKAEVVKKFYLLNSQEVLSAYRF